MNENKVNNLINKLNYMLSVDGVKPSISPALSSSGGALTSPDPIYIDETLNIDKLSQNQILLVHALLHRFYASGNKNLDKTVIEKLHKEISHKMNHIYFDRLDRVEINE